MSRILVVDDERDVLNAVVPILEDAGHDVITCTNSEDALNQIADDLPDLVVLDIIMPGLDGVEVCRRIRANPFSARLPVLFLTAKGRSADVVAGLDAGGDDYLVKPFDVIELPARVRALLRRAPGGDMDPQNDYLKAGRLRVHVSRMEARFGDEKIILTPVEHRLLCYLMSHAGSPVPIDKLLQDVWGYPEGVGNPKLVRAHVANLRSKLPFSPDDLEYIQNIHRQGYLIYRR
jgi:DNA-binding response OmpR family regulator